MLLRSHHIPVILFVLLIAIADSARAGAGPAFIENRGQWDQQARYLLRSPGMDLWITDHGMVYDLLQCLSDDGSNNPVTRSASDRHLRSLPVRRTSVCVSFLGALPGADVYGTEPTRAYHNYYVGNDRSKWATNVPLYRGARISGLYNGVDAIFYLDHGMPRYDLTVAPGADPTQVRMKIEGASNVSILPDGALAIETALGRLEQRDLLAYQQKGNLRQQVDCHFVINGNNEVGFDVGTYDHQLPLVVDPVVYATYLGGNDVDGGYGIAADHDGNAYVTGITYSTNFPTLNGVQPSYGGGAVDAFITKLSASGEPLFSTYYGGSVDDEATSVAVGGDERACFTGFSRSTDLPIVNGSQASNSGGADAFVVKLTVTGTISFATYLGGSSDDRGTGIDVDAGGNIYICGFTGSSDFPIKGGAQGSIGGGYDAFVTKLAAGGERIYSTFLGGESQDIANGIAVDGEGNACVAGYTMSRGFPTRNAFQSSYVVGEFDAFVTKLTADCQIYFSTFLGGYSRDEATSVATDSTGNIYVAGYTSSADFPVLNAAYPTYAGGISDAFVGRLTPAGVPAFFTYIGGADHDVGLAVATAENGNAYVTGGTASSNFPTKNPVQPSNAGNKDLFITGVTPGGNITFSTYLGSSSEDVGSSIAVDPDRTTEGNRHIFVVGLTESANFPFTGGIQSFCGNVDAIVVRLSVGPDAGVSYGSATLHSLRAATERIGDELRLSFELARADIITVEIFSNDGRRISIPISAREYKPGDHTEIISMAGLAAGGYILRLRSAEGWQSEKFVVVR